jgi:hypothetical protein
MRTRYWIIQGYDLDGETIFKKKVELGQFTDDQIQHLLKALTAKDGLSYGEIVGAYAKRKTKIANELLTVLTVLKDPTSHSYSCGSGLMFTARVVGEDGHIIRNPTI